MGEAFFKYFIRLVSYRFVAILKKKKKEKKKHSYPIKEKISLIDYRGTWTLVSVTEISRAPFCPRKLLRLPVGQSSQGKLN